MGIKGLTRYLNDHAEQYFTPFELHDSYLVIDGNNITCFLYTLYANCNCVFGGDYDKFSKCVSKFFDELKMCNVTPLVIFDGAHETKKIKTITMRRRQRIDHAANFTPQSQIEKKFFPTMMSYVFLDVLKAKGIKYAASLVEADSAIAAVAKVLNCPVLSNDSDFFIFGSSYIPFTTLEQGVVKGKGYNAKACKIYKIEYLLPNFNSEKMLLLPLLAMLLGNDYVKRSTFNCFLDQLLPKRRKKGNGEQYLIDALLKWIRGCTFDYALRSILRRIPKQKRQKLIDVVELIINGYLYLPTDLLVPLGIPEEHYKQEAIPIRKVFKYAGDINNLEYENESLHVNESNTSAEDDDSDCDNNDNDTKVHTLPLPKWFIEEHCRMKVPSYLVTVISHKLYFPFLPLEDFSRPQTMLVCEHILRVLFGLLIPPCQRQKCCIRYLTRGNGANIEYRELTFNNCLTLALPSLDCLRTISIDERRQILNNTLKINTHIFRDIPSNWQLYIAAIIFWAQQQKKISTIHCHIYSLLLCMLFHIIDDNIGFYRHLEKFNKNYNEILPTKNKLTCQKENVINTSIIEACEHIDKNDCLLAAPFFIANFKGNGKLFTRRAKFFVSIVHFFSQFQNCVKYIIDLNELLGCPYETLVISNLYNGTFLYNLVENLRHRKHVEAYIATILGQSPSLLHLYNALVHKVQPYLSKETSWDQGCTASAEVQKS